MNRTALLILFFSSAAHAGGFAVAEQSSVAAATGGAGTARAGDASAAWYNPAALTDGGGFRLTMGMLLAAPSVTSTAMNGSWSADSQSQVLTPPHLYMTYARNNWATGLAVTVPYGAGIAWPDNWAGQFEVESTSLQVFRVSQFSAYRFGKLSVALGVHVDFGKLDLERKLDFIDTTGDVKLALTGAGFGLDAALFFPLGDSIDAGLSYKGRTSLSMSGDAVFRTPPEFTGKAQDQGASTTMTLPDRIAAGVRVRATHRVDVLADAEVMLWDTNDQLAVHFDHDSSLDMHQKEDWSTTVALRVGTEWRPSREWALRAGAFFDPSPAPDSTMTPTTPDFTRVGASIGTGMRITRSYTLDSFYEYIQLLGRTSTNVDSLAAKYDGHAHILGVGLSYHE